MEQKEETQEAPSGRAPAPRWLRALCDREWKIPAPIAFELDGERWIAAVTHCQVVAIRSDAEADEAPADIASRLSAWLSQPTPLLMSREVVRVAVSRPLPSDKVGPKGEWPIEIAGQPFNARLLRRALRHLPIGDSVAVSETIASADSSAPPLFSGDGWRIALMPLVPLAKPAPCAVLARFRREGDRIVLDTGEATSASETADPKTTVEGRVLVSQDALDALLTAGIRARWALEEAGGFEGVEDDLQDAVSRLAEGDKWEATAGERRCVVTGFWEYARMKAASVLNVRFSDVTMRRLS